MFSFQLDEELEAFPVEVVAMREAFRFRLLAQCK